MKFTITRTSKYGEKPCEEATEGTYIYVDKRTFKSPEEHDARCKPTWYEAGFNHRLVDGGIARDTGPHPCWEIEISTIEELVALANKYGELVINTNEIEIYDTYRE